MRVEHLFLAVCSFGASSYAFVVPRTSYQQTPQRTRTNTVHNVATVPTIASTTTEDKISKESPLRVIIAGAGVGGLALANIMSKNPCVNVTLLERTQSFKRFGGPIQLASNALQILKEMDIQVYNKVMEKFTFTGDKRNGIKDGIRDEWYATFDLGSPAKARNMPYTGVIERPDLQDIYLRSLPEGVLRNGKSVQSYTSKPDGIHVTLEDRDTGIETITGDVLIGADGIWSNVRAAMRDEPAKGEGSGATYSGYTVFAGELNYDSFDNGEVGYKVYIGPGQYFVITDIGKGRYQWYAFLARPPDSADNVEKKEGSSLYLQNIFKGWSEDVHHILKATTEEEIQQRDLWDRPPSVAKPWTDGSVALLGDSIHAMMPNLGQGGCQAMEDAFVLAQEIEKCESRTEIPNSLETYRNRRLIRSAVVQGLSRFASDIIIRGFDTPAKITKDEDGKIQFENFNYAGIVTKMLQPILPIFFSVQFNFLYEGWRNEAAIDFKATVGFVFIGGFILLLSGGAVGGAVGEVGLLGGLGLDSLLGGEGIEALLANLQDFF